VPLAAGSPAVLQDHGGAANLGAIGRTLPERGLDLDCRAWFFGSAADCQGFEAW